MPERCASVTPSFPCTCPALISGYLAQVLLHKFPMGTYLVQIQWGSIIQISCLLLSAGMHPCTLSKDAFSCPSLDAAHP